MTIHDSHLAGGGDEHSVLEALGWSTSLELGKSGTAPGKAESNAWQDAVLRWGVNWIKGPQIWLSSWIT